MARRYYKKNYNSEVYLAFLIIALLINYKILNFISENPIVIVLGITLIVAGIISKYYIGKLKEQKKVQREREQLRRYRTISDLINKYSSRPTEFEHYVASVFRCLGYKAQTTSASNDGGKDIIMYKNNYKYVVEVKLYSPDNKVSRGKIQKLHSARIDCKADKAIFVTTSSFTQNSIQYANKHGIRVIDGNRLVELIDKVNGESKEVDHAFDPSDLSWLLEEN